MKLLEPMVVVKKATFGMSWFWFPEAQFGAALGVVRTKVGYAGGGKLDPTYRDMGDHTETIQLDYDPSVTNYSKLLDIFWKNHDPTSKCSRQYMSAIFYHDEEQKQFAEATKKQFKTNMPITTKIMPADRFYDAEDYHQKYLLQRQAALCHMLGVDPSGEELFSSHVLSRVNGYVGGYGNMAAFEEEWPQWGISEQCASAIRKQIAKAPNTGMCAAS